MQDKFKVTHAPQCGAVLGRPRLISPLLKQGVLRRISIKGGKLLVDCGWPGTLSQFSAELKCKGVAIQDLKYLLVTHFHPDHAGLTQELKNLGIKHILQDAQIGFVSQLTEFFKTKNLPYVNIQTNDSILLKFNESRKFLAGVGFEGEVIHTPGHSDDSVTLILDDGCAFVGDLQPLFLLPDEDTISKQSWDKIHQHKIVRIFPAHGN